MHVPHATNFYGKFENLNFHIFCKKRVLEIKMAITFAYGLGKKRIIYQKLSTQNFTSDFNSRRPFAQILLSPNSKGKYESRKILVFVRNNEKKYFFFGFFHFFCCFFYFLVILKFFINFRILEFFKFFLSFFEYFEFKN
jgi:hypothetical protein